MKPLQVYSAFPHRDSTKEYVLPLNAECIFSSIVKNFHIGLGMLGLTPARYFTTERGTHLTMQISLGFLENKNQALNILYLCLKMHREFVVVITKI